MSSLSDSSMSFSPESPNPIVHINRDPNWPVLMDLHLNSLSNFTREFLSQGKRLTPDSKKELIHKVVDTVRQKTHFATRSQFSTIAQRLVARYPESLQDRIDESILGSGYDTILCKLVSRNQNLNRNTSKLCLSGKKRPIGDTETEDDASVNVRSVDEKRDSYGCVKWAPEIQPDKLEEMENTRDALINMSNSDQPDSEQVQQKMDETYPLQRKDINNCASIVSLKSSWPYLFTVQGLMKHAEMLLGFNIRLVIGNTYDKKASRLTAYFRKSSDKNDFIFEEARRQSCNDNMKAWLSAVLLCIMGLLAEKEENLIQVVDETATMAHAKASIGTESPVLVVFGDSTLAGKTYTVMCDNEVIIPKTQSFVDSCVLFGIYYVFNLQYQQGAAATLEFIQRCFVGINPDRGSKANQGKKKKTQMNAKVLKLISSISDYEWLEQ